MKSFDNRNLEKLYVPKKDSHKGQNGKVMVIGGSHLFHAASLWALTIASKIVDMVFYASVPENNEIVAKEKDAFRNGIVVSRENIDEYLEEVDCIVIGPGMARAKEKIKDTRYKIQNFKEIKALEDEGEQTYWITKLMLEKYPHKKFVLDAGALQMMNPEWLLKLKITPILTPHHGEFEKLFGSVISNEQSDVRDLRAESEGISRYARNDIVAEMAKRYHTTILLKGPEDIICSPFDSAQGETRCVRVSGGNAGMTKGGTGDVLAGLTAALYSQNDDPFLVAQAASFFNKKAGESLYEKVGLYFNASDLVEEIPVVMKQYLLG